MLLAPSAEPKHGGAFLDAALEKPLGWPFKKDKFEKGVLLFPHPENDREVVDARGSSLDL